MMVRVNIHERYELTWVRVDICCVIKDVNSYHCRILTSLSQCGAYPQIPGRGRTGMTASFPYRGDVRTQSSVVRPWYYSRTSSVILSDCGRAVARSR